MSRPTVSRRVALRRGGMLAAGLAGTLVAGCGLMDSQITTLATTPTAPSESARNTTTAPAANRTLLVYFSRSGENYYYGGRRDLEVGNTEVLARMISELIDADVYQIEAADPYPDSYDATVQRNVAEQDADARPVIANPIDSIASYDVVLVGSPIWNVRPPMIMTTFAERYDFTGKQIHPFVTHAVSGLGNTQAVYTAAFLGARIGPGLAIQGEEVSQRRSDVEAWLARVGLTP
jgi:flavodoxin